MRKLTMEEVTFELKVEQEDTPLRGNVLASGDDEADAGAENDVRKALDAGNIWVWCTTTVIARWNGFEGRDNLGCCSYGSEEEFRQDDCYESLKQSALDNLNRVISNTADRLRTLNGEVEPGTPIVSVTCPCCGATLEVVHGDEEGEVGVLGTPTKYEDETGELMGTLSAPMRALAAVFIDENHNEAVLLEVWPPAKSPEDPWGCEFEAAGCRHLDELGMGWPPATGLWVWEGNLYYPNPDYVGICDDGPEWRGRWRRAGALDVAPFLGSTLQAERVGCKTKSEEKNG